MMSYVKFPQAPFARTHFGEWQFFSSGARQGAPDGVASLKVRKSASDALHKGSEAPGKVK